MERLTKILITAWACAAVAWQVTRMLSWPNLPLLAAAAALAAFLLVRLDRRAVGAVLVFAYIFPAVLRMAHGSPYTPFAVLWIAALLGAILPDARKTSWHIPSWWRAALVFAAAVAAVGSAIVVWREVDGVWPLATRPTEALWMGSTPPPFIVSWVIHTALILGVGVLWFDWLSGMAVSDVERAVITPLVVSAAMMSSVSVYQMLVDISVFNETAFATMKRATGTMYDANVAGIIAALWTGGTLLWAARGRGWRVYAAPPLVALNAAAVWGSGSRTALTAMLVACASALVSLFLARREALSRRWVVTGATGLAVVGLAVGLAAAGAGTVNPAQRLWHSLPSADLESVQRFGKDLWERNGYGSAAHTMIREFPVGGVGLGSFHGFVTEYGARIGKWLPPDNAQGWPRQQIAELGAAGAAGWIVWVVAFGLFVIRPRAGEPPAAWTARGILAAFGVLSLVAMPGQDLMVAITFWTFAAWYVGLVGAPVSRPLAPPVWAAMAVGLVVFAAASASAAANELRITNRALRLKAPLSYGFATPEPAGADAGFRRTQAAAVAIVQTAPRWMAVVVKRADPSTAGPVSVRVWCDGETVLKATLTQPDPITAFVPIKQPGRVVLETSSRHASFRPWTRRPELFVKWEFVHQPPPGFRGYQGVSATSE